MAEAQDAAAPAGRISIRGALPSDTPQIVVLGARMHRESSYRDLDYREDKVRSTLALVALQPSRYCLQLAELEGRIVGFIGGYLEEYLFSHQLVAHDIAFFVDPAHRGTFTAPRLIHALANWARQRGAHELCLGISSGIATQRVGRLYERLGFTCVGAIYKQRLDRP